MKNLVQFTLVFLLLFTAAFASAQTGTISGKVTDDEGVPLQGATVEVVGTTLKATADAEGAYTIADVPVGEHTLRGSTYSYKTTESPVTVTAGQTITQDFALKIDLLAMEEIVVTGTSTAERKIESSNSISTLDTEEIREAAPRSTTEYLRRVPGFTRVESSGGEVNQNISVRGFLGVETVNFQEDGMPVYPTMHVFFMNADNLIRPDENLSEVEIVRGSDSPIFGSSASAAIVNFINKTGGDELHGTVKGIGGQDGLGRFDFNMNGPLSDEWRFNVGGFYRYDHGSRDPGYPGTRGGQIKANVTRLMDNGFFRISGKYIDDKNQFILPLPFQNPSDPDFVPGFSHTGSYTTPEGVDIRAPLIRGDDLVHPLDDGIFTNGGWITGHASFNFGDNWEFEDIAQGMSVNHQWNAIAPGNPAIATEYAQGVLNGLITQGIVPTGSTYQLLFTNDPDTNGHKVPFNTPNGLVAPSSIFHVEKPISSFSNMINLRARAGDHKLAFGNYFAYYTQDNSWMFSDILMDIRDNPRLLDMVVTTPTGENVNVTLNGFRKFLSTYVNAHGNNTLFAIYGNDDWAATDRLRLDFGLRYEHQNYFQVAENSSSQDLDGNARTIYDIETFGNQTFRQFNFDIDDVAYSFGVNYQLKPDHLALYASYTHGFWMPALDEFMFEQRQELVDLFEPRKTNMVEGGVKYSGRQIGFTATAFYGKLFNVTSRGVEFDPVTGSPVFVTRVSPDTSGYGFEFEVLTRPIKEFEVRSAMTLIDTKAPAGAQAQTRTDGLTPAVLDFEFAYLFYEGARLSLDWHYVGNRFTNDQRTVQLDSYSYINLGGSYEFREEGITIGARVLNLNDSQGFEEGDPRNDPNRGGAANLFNARPILPRRFVVDARYDW